MKRLWLAFAFLMMSGALRVLGAQKNLYLVIDLSGGVEAESYPCRYTDTAPDLSDDACRTTELWLRRIPRGTFVMGSPAGELGRYSNETQHSVTLTKDYYIGVFECTQKQYELVVGSNPSDCTGDLRPVEQVSYNDLRGTVAGAQWPASSGGGRGLLLREASREDGAGPGPSDGGAVGVRVPCGDHDRAEFGEGPHRRD